MVSGVARGEGGAGGGGQRKGIVYSKRKRTINMTHGREREVGGAIETLGTIFIAMEMSSEGERGAGGAEESSGTHRRNKWAVFGV